MPDSLELLHQLLTEVGEAHDDLDAADLMLFETAVVEIAGNVVEHGRPPGHVVWDFVLSVRDDRLESTLTDSGQAFSGVVDGAMPDASAESGRGFPLAQASLDELSYERVGDRNRWRMVRLRAQR